MTPFLAVILDLDGTMLDSIPDLAHATNGMRVEMGMMPLHEDVIGNFVGKGVDNLVRRTLAGQLDADLWRVTGTRVATSYSTFHVRGLRSRDVVVVHGFEEQYSSPYGIGTVIEDNAGAVHFSDVTSIAFALIRNCPIHGLKPRQLQTKPYCPCS